MSDQLATTLRDALFERFSDEELGVLCAGLGLDFARLPGEGKFGKTRELVRAAQARDRLRLLAARARDLHPELTDILAVAVPAPNADPIAPASDAAAKRPAETPGRLWPLAAGSARRLIVLIAIVALALLCLWVALSSGLGALLSGRGVEVMPKPTVAQAFGTASPVPGSTATFPVVTLAPAVTARPGVTALPAPAATLNPSAVPTAALAATTARPAATAAPGVTAVPGATAPPATPSGPDPARTVREMNAQLIDFYTARVDGAALSQFWREGPRQSVLTFAESPLLRLLGLTPQARADSLDVQMKYAREPALTQKTETGALVNAREYWRYANTKTGRVICETRDYTYRLAFENGRYVVDSFQGELIDSKCAD